MAPSTTSTDISVVVDHGLLELVSPLICLLHPNGIVAFINQAGVKMLGLTSSGDAIGTAFENFIGEDYRFLVEIGWDLLTEEDVLPLQLTRTDGSVFAAEIRVRRVPSDHTILVEARDISLYVKASEALREREERLQGILSSVAEGIVTFSERGRIVSANPAAEAMFRVKRDALNGRRISDLMQETKSLRHNRLAGEDLAHLLPQLTSGHATERQGLRPDGTDFPMEVSVSTLRHGRHRLFTAIIRDISERKEQEERIRRLAHHDSLTGLPNRNLLADRLNHAVARAQRSDSRLAIFFVDLDRFKPINDSLGHPAGDYVLKEVAHRLLRCVRASDTVARIGGDEFVVVIEDIPGGIDAAPIARKILRLLSQPIDYQGTGCRIGASIGVAIYPEDGECADDLCKAADMAMYRVKRSGRNGFCFFAATGRPVEELQD